MRLGLGLGLKKTFWVADIFYSRSVIKSDMSAHKTDFFSWWVIVIVRENGIETQWT